jgi:hypothetical protein
MTENYDPKNYITITQANNNMAAHIADLRSVLADAHGMLQHFYDYGLVTVGDQIKLGEYLTNLESAEMKHILHGNSATYAANMPPGENKLKRDVRLSEDSA